MEILLLPVVVIVGLAAYIIYDLKKYSKKFTRHDVGVGAIETHARKTLKRNARLLKAPERMSEKQLKGCTTEYRQCQWFLSLPADCKSTIYTQVKMLPFKDDDKMLTLQAELIRNERGCKKFLLACHGYHSSPLWMLSYGKLFYENWNFNICAIHERAHNGSEGETVSMGIYEAQDIHAWVDYLLENYGTDIEIVLAGVSMGAASLLFSLRQKYPEQVKFAILDCAFDSLYTLFSNKKKKSNETLAQWQWSLCRALLQYSWKIDLSHYDAEYCLSANRLPLLITHGTGDTLIPEICADNIYKAACANHNPHVTLVKIAAAEHARAIEEGAEELSAHIADYVTRFVGK